MGMRVISRHNRGCCVFYAWGYGDSLDQKTVGVLTTLSLTNHPFSSISVYC